MSITRLGEFQARPGQQAILRQQSASFLLLLTASPGCQSCEASQGVDDPTRFVIIEV